MDEKKRRQILEEYLDGAHIDIIATNNSVSEAEVIQVLADIREEVKSI